MLSSFNGIMPSLVPEIVHSLNTSQPIAIQAVAIASFAWAFTGPAVGPLADRIGDYYFIVLGTLGMAISSLLSSITPNIVVPVLVRLLGGVGAGISAFTAQAYVAKYWPEEDQPTSFGITLSGYSIGIVAVIPIFLYLASIIGWQLSLALMGITILIVALVLMKFLNRTNLKGGNAQDVSITKVIKNIHLTRLIAANALQQNSYFAMYSFFPLLLRLDYGFTLENLAWVMALLGIIAVVGALAGGVAGNTLMRHFKEIYAVGIATSGLLALAAFAFRLTIPQLLFIMGLAIVAESFVRPFYLSTLGATTQAKSTAMGLNNSSNQIGALAGTSVLGALVPMAPIAVGIYAAFSGLISALIVPGRKRLT